MNNTTIFFHIYFTVKWDYLVSAFAHYDLRVKLNNKIRKMYNLDKIFDANIWGTNNYPKSYYGKIFIIMRRMFTKNLTYM